MSNHILEKLVNQMPGTLKEKDEKLHAAMLLAFYGAAQSTAGKEILSTPLFGITYDKKNQHLKFENFDGIAKDKKKDKYIVSALDMTFACHDRDMPLIFEGDTGVGKTITIEAYLKTILPEESFVVMSLSHDSFTDNPKSPFIDSEIEEGKGMPKTFIDREKLRKIATMYIEEVNLGNPNDLLQLSYGRVLVSKERGVAGIVVPQLTEEGVKSDEEYLKRLWLSGSQNPPKSRDVQFTGIELTAAMKNRFLIIKYPKIIRSVGSTMWLKEKENGLHGKFLEEFTKKYQELTGQAISVDDLRKDWLDVYAYTLDSKRTEKALIRSTLEFGDILMIILSGDLAKTYQIEKEITEGWKENFPDDASSNFTLRDTIQDTEEVKRLNKVLDSFGKPLTERDDDYIKILADLFATIKSLKGAYSQKQGSVLEHYLQNPHYITVEDVAAAAILLAKNKQVKQERDPAEVVNSVLKEYTSLMDELAEEIKVKDYIEFDAENRDIGIKHIIYTSALKDAGSAKDVVQKINNYVGRVKNLDSTSDIRKVIVARTVADLATITGFIMEHEDEIDRYINANKKKGLRSFVKELYEKELGNPTFDPVYSHRLPRVI